MPGACAGWRPPVPGPFRVPAGVLRCPALVEPGVPGLGRASALPGAQWWRAGGWCPRVADAWIVCRLASPGARPGSWVGRRASVPGPGRASAGVPRCSARGRASASPGRSVVAGRGRCPRVADAWIVGRTASSGARLPDRASGGGPAGCSVVAGRGPVPSGGRCPDRAPAGVPRIVPRSAALPGVHRWRARGRCPRVADARIVGRTGVRRCPDRRRTASPGARSRSCPGRRPRRAFTRGGPSRRGRGGGGARWGCGAPR